MTLGAPFTLATANGAAAADLEELVALLPLRGHALASLFGSSEARLAARLGLASLPAGRSEAPSGSPYQAGCSASFKDVFSLKHTSAGPGALPPTMAERERLRSRRTLAPHGPESIWHLVSPCLSHDCERDPCRNAPRREGRRPSG